MDTNAPRHSSMTNVGEDIRAEEAGAVAVPPPLRGERMLRRKCHGPAVALALPCCDKAKCLIRKQLTGSEAARTTAGDKNTGGQAVGGSRFSICPSTHA